ncbi:hypothetical protein [Microbacterium enclense]|uniref:hypothetical protein n=1 Tax=Microbacterium enclense TaxID=993073 RepID=UPI003F806ED5
MSTFLESQHDRDTAGRFTEMAGSEQPDVLELDTTTGRFLDDLDTAQNAYLELALVLAENQWRAEFSTYTPDGQFISDEDVPAKSTTDFSDRAVVELRAEFGHFIDANQQDIVAALRAGYDAEKLGADFLLDRNGQGGGFRDRGLPDGVAKRLAASADSYGFQFATINSLDGKVELHGGDIPAPARRDESLVWAIAGDDHETRLIEADSLGDAVSIAASEFTAQYGEEYDPDLLTVAGAFRGEADDIERLTFVPVGGLVDERYARRALRNAD